MTTKAPSTRPDVWSLPVLDATVLEPVARRTVRDRLKMPRASAQNRLKAAADLMTEEMRNEEHLREQRDRVAVAIATYCNLRRGSSMHEALGVSRSRWTAIKKSVPTNRLPKSLADVDELMRLAAETHAAQLRIEAAREVRDELVRELVDAGWNNVQIVKLIGLDRSQVARIKSPDQRQPATRPPRAIVA